MSRRETGTGTIERRTNPDGTESFRARVVLPDGRVSSPWLASPEEAEEFGQRLRERGRRGEIRARAGLTLGDWWRQHVEHLEALRKPRAVHYDRVWRQHVQHYAIAEVPLVAIEPRGCRAFVEDLLRAKVAHGSRTIAPGTAHQAWSIFSAVLSAAVEREMIPSNPAKKVKIEWPETEDETLDYWEPAEIARVLSCEAIPLPDRLVIQFALGTGLRAGELVWMPLPDLERAVERGELLVRQGSRTRKPKSGKTRTIPLLPMARAAAEQWLARPAPANPRGLAFPTVRGAVRNSSAVLGLRKHGRTTRARFVDWQEAAGVHRIVWHGLRHTCGAALVSGWWGRVWALHELRDLLGHSSVTTTERVYGHLAPSALRAAAEATRGGGVPAVSRGSPDTAPSGPKPPESQQIPYFSTLQGKPSNSAEIDGLRDIAGLRTEILAQLATGWRPDPEECAAVARHALRLHPVARAAQAVLDAAPEHKARRLIDLLDLLPAVMPRGATCPADLGIMRP